MRNPKTLGLALVAVLAMSGFGATVAQAAFTVGTGGTEVRVSQEGTNELLTGIGETSCESVTGHGEVSEGSTSGLPFTLSYSGCESLGLAADITLDGGCYIDITDNGIVHLCPTGGWLKITVTSAGVSVCTTLYHKQTMTTAAYKNLIGSPMKVSFEGTFTSMAYETEGGKGFCGTTGLHEDGEFIGNTRIEVVNGGGTGVDITHD